jgi:hypothetical protein
MVFFTECFAGRKRGQLRGSGEIDYKQAGGFGKMEKRKVGGVLMRFDTESYIEER